MFGILVSAFLSCFFLSHVFMFYILFFTLYFIFFTLYFIFLLQTSKIGIKVVCNAGIFHKEIFHRTIFFGNDGCIICFLYDVILYAIAGKKKYFLYVLQILEFCK